MKMILAILAMLAVPSFAQQPVRWFATTGDVSLSGTATTATIQQPAINGFPILLDQIVVYCSVACNATQAAYGAAATTTAGTVQAIIPFQINTPFPFNFFTASNVGTGTAQGGVTHISAGATVILCMSASCGASSGVILPNNGTNVNYSVTIASITGTANITYYGHIQQQ